MIAIVDYGAGNLRSVKKAFECLSVEAEITDSPDKLRLATHVVLPGVGAFSAGMKNLVERGLKEEILREAKSGKPFLGICLGMQMLLEESEEGGKHEGLGLMPGVVKRFIGEMKIPHMGWNTLRFRPDPVAEGLAEGTCAYFVHSYWCDVQKRDVLAETEYGVVFPSAVKRGNIYGFQFHPEKSGDAGLRLLKNFAALRG